LLTHLTDLQLVLGHGPALHSGVDSLRDCRALRRLDMLVIYDDVWAQVLAAPSSALSRTLESLSLAWVQTGGVITVPLELTPVDWRACFANLRANLRHLRVNGCRDLVPLLQALVDVNAEADAPPALRQLELVLANSSLSPSPSPSPSPSSSDAAGDARALLAQTLRRLLLSMPHLELRLCLPYSDGASEDASSSLPSELHMALDEFRQQERFTLTRAQPQPAAIEPSRISMAAKIADAMQRSA
jgi:hypothetical protein